MRPNWEDVISQVPDAGYLHLSLKHPLKLLLSGDCCYTVVLVPLDNFSA